MPASHFDVVGDFAVIEAFAGDEKILAAALVIFALGRFNGLRAAGRKNPACGFGPENCLHPKKMGAMKGRIGRKTMGLGHDDLIGSGFYKAMRPQQGPQAHTQAFKLKPPRSHSPGPSGKPEARPATSRVQRNFRTETQSHHAGSAAASLFPAQAVRLPWPNPASSDGQ